jgi:hypothetical protein
VPRELRHLATIFRAENVFTSIAAAGELHGLTGFNLSELVVFRPQRLALHELLVRITADFAVPDGTRIADLGLNFREIARLLLSRYLEPAMDAITAAYRCASQEANEVIEPALSRLKRNWGPHTKAWRAYSRRYSRRKGRRGAQRISSHRWRQDSPATISAAIALVKRLRRSCKRPRANKDTNFCRARNIPS